jgi:hypothetical protein
MEFFSLNEDVHKLLFERYFDKVTRVMLRGTNKYLNEKVVGKTIISLTTLLKKGYSNIFRAIIETGFRINPITINKAIQYNRLDDAYWLVTNGHNFNKTTLEYAVYSNDFDFFRFLYLYDNKVKLDKSICYHAVQGGNVDILTFVLRYVEKIPTKMCLYAADCGNLEMLKWFRYREYHWDASVCIKAVEKGYLDVLVWAIENDCPHSIVDCVFYAINNNQLDIATWFNDKYPLDGFILFALGNKWPDYF